MFRFRRKLLIRKILIFSASNLVFLILYKTLLALVKEAEFNSIQNNPDIFQNDSRILDYLLRYHISRPSEKLYKLKLDVSTTQFPKSIEKLFKGKNRRFFIEAGAEDGGLSSNTLQLETKQGWTGLLIEPNSFLFSKLRSKNRKAWISDTCLSLDGLITKAMFQVRIFHRLVDDSTIKNAKISNEPPVPVQQYVFAGLSECFPIHSLLSAINIIDVDFFSLDIDGSELKVLRTIPFDLLIIKIFVIKHEFVEEGFEAVAEFLYSKNYQIIAKDNSDVWFIREDFYKEYMDGILDAFGVDLKLNQLESIKSTSIGRSK